MVWNVLDGAEEAADVADASGRRERRVGRPNCSSYEESGHRLGRRFQLHTAARVFHAGRSAVHATLANRHGTRTAGDQGDTGDGRAPCCTPPCDISSVFIPAKRVDDVVTASVSGCLKTGSIVDTGDSQVQRPKTVGSTFIFGQHLRGSGPRSDMSLYLEWKYSYNKRKVKPTRTGRPLYHRRRWLLLSFLDSRFIHGAESCLCFVLEKKNAERGSFCPRLGRVPVSYS